MQYNNKQIKAIEYLGEGFSIAPVKVTFDKGGRKKVDFPIPWKQYQEKIMTEDEAVKIWKDDSLSISIITGEISGITVIDIDMDKTTGKPKASVDSFPETYTVETQSGGIHLYYKYNKSIKQTTGFKINKGKTEEEARGFMMPGGEEVDIRNDGGLVIAPSCDDDDRYQVKKSIAMVEAPEYLFDLQINQNKIPHTTIAMLEQAEKGTWNRTAFEYFLTELQKVEHETEFPKVIDQTIFQLQDVIDGKDSENNLRSTFKSCVKRIKDYRKDMTDAEVRRSVKAARNRSDTKFFEQIDEHFIKDHENIAIIVRGKDVYYYEYKDGVYNVLEDIIMEAKISNYIKLKGMLQYNKANYHSEVRKRIQNYLINVPEKCFHEINEDYINLRNGLYDIDNHKLLPHNKEIFSVTQLPFAFDKKATKMPIFEKYLKTTSQGDVEQVRMIQQVFGYVIGVGNPRHKLHLFYGPTARNGKSVLAKLLTFFVGEKNAGVLSLDQMSGRNAHNSVQLENKRINISDEGTSKYIEAPEITSMTSEGSILINKKYKDMYSYTVTANFIVCSNDLPRFKDGIGMANRIIIIPFNYQVPEQDRILKLEKKIAEAELPAIFNWALQGHDEVAKDGFFISKESQKQVNKYSLANNSVLAFLDECCELVEGEYTSYAEFYGETGSLGYRGYCYNEGGKQLSKKKVIEEMRRLMDLGKLDGLSISQGRNAANKNSRGFEGIKIIDKNLVPFNYDLP